MRYNGFWILASAILLTASVVPARANLITDPGFESCTSAHNPVPDWTGSGTGVFCGGNPHTGNFDADFGVPGATLSQTITTIAGDDYDFSFWLKNGTTAVNSFTASFDSDQVLDLVNSSVSGYMLEDFTVTATGTSATIAFDGTTAGGGIWMLDDVSVTDQGPAAPEPASLVLLASGLLAIAWRFRRQRA